MSALFNQRKLFFELLLCLKRVDYGAGKENFIEILSSFDELVSRIFLVDYIILHQEKTYKAEVDPSHFKWSFFRNCIVYQVSLLDSQQFLLICVCRLAFAR